MSMDADELVRRFVLRQYRRKYVHAGYSNRAAAEHLQSCPDITVTDQEAYDGEYGCDTGCEYARLEATLRCPHGFSDDFEYGEFGDVADINKDQERDAELNQ